MPRYQWRGQPWPHEQPGWTPPPLQPDPPKRKPPVKRPPVVELVVKYVCGAPTTYPGWLCATKVSEPGALCWRHR